MDELRPCPFCGGEPIAVETHPGAGYIECTRCGCAMDEYEAGDPDTRTEHWNRRTGACDRDALLALADELAAFSREGTCFSCAATGQPECSCGVECREAISHSAARRIREACGEAV